MRGALLVLIAILVAIAVFQALKPLWIKRDYDRMALAGLTIGILPLALPVVVIGIVLTLRPFGFWPFFKLRFDPGETKTWKDSKVKFLDERIRRC